MATIGNPLAKSLMELNRLPEADKIGGQVKDPCITSPSGCEFRRLAGRFGAEPRRQ